MRSAKSFPRAFCTKVVQVFFSCKLGFTRFFLQTRISLDFLDFPYEKLQFTSCNQSALSNCGNQSSVPIHSKFLLKNVMGYFFKASSTWSSACDFDWISWANKAQHFIKLTSSMKSLPCTTGSLNGKLWIRSIEVCSKCSVNKLTVYWRKVSYKSGKAFESFTLIKMLEKLLHFSARFLNVPA